jgi:hypothetical protein
MSAPGRSQSQISASGVSAAHGTIGPSDE